MGLSGNLRAQEPVSGKVIQADTKEPVEYATIQLFHGESTRMVNYTLTDAQGNFSLSPGTYVDSLTIGVSLLGFRKIKVPVRPGLFLPVELEAEYFDLREVEIRPGRVWGRQDTVNYDVTQFLSAQDQHIKDVIKKLPGVDVDELGRISYNGKEISHFYVEGMDLMGGRYNQISENLRAESVDKIQILENHQPIRVLTDKIKTEDVAINLKLKPEFKDRWMATVSAGGGFSPFLWMTENNAMQLSRKSQSAYIYKGNNTGKDITTEHYLFRNVSLLRIPDPTLSPFIPLPSFSSTLKEKRWLFNDAHSLSANRLYRLNEDTRLRINANYLHDTRKQDRGEETLYYTPEQNSYIREESATNVRTDKGELTFHLENNKADYYLTNQLDVSGSWNHANSFFYNQEDISQQVRQEERKVRNYFQMIQPHETYMVEYRSLAGYYYLPSVLEVNEQKKRFPLKQFYTDNSVSFIKKKNSWSRQYTGGFTGEATNLKDGYGIYFTPQHQVNTSRWTATIRLPLHWKTYTHADFSRVSLNPSVSFSYKYNYRWLFAGYAGYSESYGDITGFYEEAYYTGYRHIRLNEGALPVYKQQFYSLRAEYKNTIRELFFSINPTYSRTHQNLIHEQRLEGEVVWSVYQPLKNVMENYTLNTIFSKGFYDWRLNTSLSYRMGRTKGEQLNEGLRLSYRQDYIQLEPKLTWYPAKYWNATYESAVSGYRSKFGEVATLDPLWNVVQKIAVSYELYPFTLQVEGDHYYNQITRGQSVHALFADLMVRWKSGKWQVEIRGDNLFNKKQYGYTQYGTHQVYTSWAYIRPREITAAVRYRF